MRIPLPNPRMNLSKETSHSFFRLKRVVRFAFIFVVSLAITLSNYAQEEDSDFLDKVLEDKTKKTEPKKISSQNQSTTAGLKDKKKKGSKNAKKSSKTAAKFDPNKKPVKPGIPLINPSETANTNVPPTQNLNNNKLNLEYWMHEELTMNSDNVPGLVVQTPQNNPNPSNPATNQTIDKPIEKKNPDKIGKESKPNAIIAFLNEYKKIILIFAAIIIFAIYRLRSVGPRDYNNSGRIFSKFRNK